MQDARCPTCNRKLLRYEIHGGHFAVEVLCRHCRVLVTLTLPHPLTGGDVPLLETKPKK